MSKITQGYYEPVEGASPGKNSETAAFWKKVPAFGRIIPASIILLRIQKRPPFESAPAVLLYFLNNYLKAGIRLLRGGPE